MTRNWGKQNPNPAIKTKREISTIANTQNTRRTFGKASGKFFSKTRPLSNLDSTKNNMYKHKGKRHGNSDIKNR